MLSVVVVGSEGYIGSRLCAGRNFVRIDKTLGSTYADVPTGATVVFLAGHSSIANFKEDSETEQFAALVKRAGKFIFASSMLVYGESEEWQDEKSPLHPVTQYAKQKEIAEQLCKHAVVLRFGSVCGVSPKMRNDVLMNKMVYDAKNGLVKVCGKRLWRPVLGLHDLCCAIDKVLDRYCPGIYNLCSFNSDIASLGAMIAVRFGADFEVGDSEAIGIRMMANKFKKTYNFQFTDTAASVMEELCTL